MTGDNSSSAMTDSNSTIVLNTHLFPVYARVLLISLYLAIVVISVGGNSLIIGVIVVEKRMRTVTNWFIVNLACADVLMATVCVPFTFVANVLLQHWPFGGALCPLVGYSQTVAVFLGAFTLVAISVDRHRAIRHPLRARLTRRQLIGAIIIIWAAALTLSLPVAVLSRVVTQTELGAGSLDYCKEQWPSARWRSWYTVTIMVAQYFLPLGVMSATYSSIAYIVWLKRQVPGEAVGPRDNKIAASKKKMVKMMATVVIIYALCWLPLHSVTLAGDTNPDVWFYRHIQVIWIASHWLAMSNCCYNPFVYFWMSSNFRAAFRRLGGIVLCRGRDEAAVAGLYMSPAARARSDPGGRLTVRFANNSDDRMSSISPDLTPRLTR